MQMVMFMKANSEMVKKMAKERYDMPMEVCTMVNGLREKNMVKLK